MTAQLHQAAINATHETDAGVPTHRIGKVVCVGRNYAAHAAELGNAIPERPILFIKPASAIVPISEPIASQFKDVSRGANTGANTAVSYAVHYEAELCLRLGCDVKQASVHEVASQAGLIDAVTLGLDLTLRDLQSELKDKGHPWERAKCFDGSCVLADWISGDEFSDLAHITYQLYINDKLTQDGDTALMLFPIYELISEISYAMSLQAGDVIMTGTPSGVGVLNAGDRLELVLGEHHWCTQVV